MTKHLDPKFAKVIALMNSTEHVGEKQAALARAKAIAAAAGMTLDEALKAAVAKPEPAPFVNIMDSFDDFMERENPGYKAERAAEKRKKADERRARLTGLLDRYGSREAVLAPCEKEVLS